MGKNAPTSTVRIPISDREYELADAMLQRRKETYA